MGEGRTAAEEQGDVARAGYGGHLGGGGGDSSRRGGVTHMLHKVGRGGGHAVSGQRGVADNGGHLRGGRGGATEGCSCLCYP